MFGDSLFAARKLKYAKCGLAAVYAETCPDSFFDAHNATGDCHALTAILNKWRTDPEIAMDSKVWELFAPKHAHEVMNR